MTTSFSLVIMPIGSDNRPNSSETARAPYEYELRRFDELLPYCSVMYEPKPTPQTYDEALKRFREAESSSFGEGHRLLFVHGKAALLMSMWEIDPSRTLQAMRDEFLDIIERFDPFTQYCLIDIMASRPSAVWLSPLERTLLATTWWRVRRSAVSALECVAEEERAFPVIRRILKDFIWTRIEAEPPPVREELIRCFAKACSVCRTDDLIHLMQETEPPHGVPAIVAVRESLLRISVSELCNAVVTLKNWGWIAVTLEALYILSTTRLPLPAYVSRLVSDKAIERPRGLPPPSTVQHELVACMLSEQPPQARGLRFERLFNRVMADAGCAIRGSFSRPGEQLDGLIELHGMYFLIETKWTATPTSPPALSAFRGKVESRLRGTCGIFVSVAGYTRNAVRTLERGKTQAILLLDGDDIYQGFLHPKKFLDLLDEKLQVAAGDGVVYAPLALRALLTA